MLFLLFLCSIPFSCMRLYQHFALPSGEKAGYCPREMEGELATICISLCERDDECPDDGKCCSNGCGKVCVPAVTTPPPDPTNSSGMQCYTLEGTTPRLLQDMPIICWSQKNQCKLHRNNGLNDLQCIFDHSFNSIQKLHWFLFWSTILFLQIKFVKCYIPPLHAAQTLGIEIMHLTMLDNKVTHIYLQYI